ncbi:MAG: hypothetical protein IT381_08365 [Deltaproteobacteria bacterium]|nr:hypothetical protein [Deltaproteobacteria bacterium]
MTFVHVSDRRTLPVEPASILFVMSSFNQVSLAVPGLDQEPAHAYIVAHKTPRGQYNVHVYILLQQTSTPVVYMRDGPPVADTGYQQVIAEALAFVESMGFLLDDIGFDKAPPEKRQAMIESFPFLREAPTAIAPGAAMEEQMLEEVAAEELRPADLLVNLDAMSQEQRLAWARFLGSF